LYARLAGPKWVIAFGTCAGSGALFDSIAVEQVIPVDLFLPGCPPHPAMLRDAVRALIQQRPR
jgi:NADH:ubiquinone oxidoreductase subunit B-like Fe-S oxidoreductase